MNVLYKNINWDIVKYVGFDMDGTLYDEFNFIVQPYKQIADLFNDSADVFKYMSHRWLEKGSSYKHIFDETFEQYTLIQKTKKEIFIQQALSIFREFNPKLNLSSRVEMILEYCKNNYKIFLVSDGNHLLQKRKFSALGLDRYFKNNVVFTNQYSNDYEKPNNRSIELMDINPKESLFFGDRDNDINFAINSKMQYKKVYNMLEVI